jgi:hypothetical protein
MEGELKMSGADIGNIVGRLFVSYVVVWIILWLTAGARDWRKTTRCTRRWYGILAVLIVFLTGVLTAMSRLSVA